MQASNEVALALLDDCSDLKEERSSFSLDPVRESSPSIRARLGSQSKYQQQEMDELVLQLKVGMKRIYKIELGDFVATFWLNNTPITYKQVCCGQ